MVAGNKNDTVVFWGCFIALVTTAFGFITRMFLITQWGDEFGLDSAQEGRLAGIGVWPFAVSIICFSLFIDKLGYKVAMVFAFICHLTWSIMGVTAYYILQGGDPQSAYRLVYWGSLVLALGNGTVEAFINPVVATMFRREKTKWLNILHAGWPGGLVIAGMIVIFMADLEWKWKVGIIAAPTIIYFLMLVTRRFPVHERVASGVSYREMLSEFGVLSAVVVGFLIMLQLFDFFSNGSTRELTTAEQVTFVGIFFAIVAGFGIYTRSFGRPLMFILVLIMMPLATTELGTDGWITGIMEGVFELTDFQVRQAGGEDEVLFISGTAYSMHPGWILVYTSAIMMVLRFFAGPIVHKFSPLGLLCISSILAIIGLYTLSMTTGAMIFAAATVYGIGKTFFWPTMLGVVAEQTPKGGALTLNAISGIGMLAVGTLGLPYIGALQANKQIEAVAESPAADQIPGLVVDGELTAVTDKSIYEIIKYSDIDDEKLEEQANQLPAEEADGAISDIARIRERSNQQALAAMTVFPFVMLIGYVGLILYFRATGGYKIQILDEKEGH